MKSFLRIPLTVALLAICAGLGAKPKQVDTLRVLAIGNSFSQNSVEQNLYEIAAAAGKTLIIGNMYIGGCSLERHYNNSVSGSDAYSYRKITADGKFSRTQGFTLEQALADEKWDVVTFQQCSDFSGKPESYEPYLTDLIKYVKARTAKGTRLMFHQTWAYAKDATHKAFPSYNNDQQFMYESIMAASKKAAKKHHLEIIPCGTAIQNLRQFTKGDDVTADGYHLNAIGMYTASCTWFESLFPGKKVFGGRYAPAKLTEDDIRAAQFSADAAVSKPYKAKLK